ncbi:MAG: hypothetical protein IJ034_02785 [Mailhella sp.]|nr:hypothetical protein [Mailhella sp.]
MEYDVTFLSGMTPSGQARSGRLIQLSADSTACILRFFPEGESLLLGDVRRISPESLPLPSSEELALLGLQEGEPVPVDMRILCRMGIPFERPQDAGFDLSRIVFVYGDRALEVERPGWPIVPLTAKG